jgi:anti-sigma regulatory factor (Ser/Thr protein kinase)
MDLTLLDLVDVETPVHIKISVSGVDLKKYVAVNAESAEELQSSKSGLGFFLVKRFVQQLQSSTESGYHMVERLIYRE